MTTGEAIRTFCKQCVNSVQRKDRGTCGGEFVIVTKKECALFKYRLRGKGSIKVIRKNCLECMGNSTKAVDECSIDDCPLHEFRTGRFSVKRPGVGRAINFQNRLNAQKGMSV
jgi:hypothetical protein